ncbi:TPA: hypothetical protein UMB92_002843 [Stenotrophomonas maltophilia]|uniref:hypothetical protein n=1 Tax=Stenotrophomonas maltophilia TaxID=40324 RepID=UPI0015DF5A32|nr:hypothetical protein [Stenotrophomonas maltophilia]MBA0448614.1 hypothetical protein [Stenotrophomonas maltophilia]HEL2979969.1 hypothetical protein [Stenotrophomonas maltophilia]
MNPRTWAFSIKGPRSSIECLPRTCPWWSLKVVHVDGTVEREASIPGSETFTDYDHHTDLALEIVVLMNGVAVSCGHSGLIEIDKHVEYCEAGKRTPTTPLRLIIKNTNLGGFGATPQALPGLENASIENIGTIKKLMLYWGQSNSETYEGLYKIYEFIKTSYPQLLDEMKHEISRRKISQLTQTCNSMSSGPTARHADVSHPPVERPMELSEIRRIVRTLSDAFLKHLKGTSAIR